MKHNKILALVLSVVLSLGLFAGCGSVNYAENNTEYVIGVSGPLTGGAARDRKRAAVRGPARVACSRGMPPRWKLSCWVGVRTGGFPRASVRRARARRVTAWARSPPL